MKRVKTYAGSTKPSWPFEINKDSEQAQGLVALWSMVGMGNEINLYSPGKSAMDQTNAPGVGFDPVMGTYRIFNGSNQYFSSTDLPASTYPLTFTCWFRPLALVNFTEYPLVYMGDANNNKYFHLYHQDGGILAEQGGSGTAFANGVVVNALQSGVAAFASATSTIAYYNGTVKTSAVVAATPTGIDRMSIGTKVFNAGPASFFNGYIYDARIYNVALTDDQIARWFSSYSSSFDLYRMPKGSKLTSPSSIAVYRNMIKPINCPKAVQQKGKNPIITKIS